MSQLGVFLEAVHGPTERFRTLRAVVRHWRNKSLADKAQRSDRPVAGRRKTQPAGATRIEEAKLSIWIALPGCLRVEKERRDGSLHETNLTVVNGEQWWSRDHEGHVETSDGARRTFHGRSDVERHFDRAQLREFFVALALEGTGTVQRAGRDCIRVRAVPRPGGLLWPHWLPYGAEDYEFHAEPQRGVLLAIIARHGGETFEINEVTRVEFDEPLDRNLFTYTPALGEQVRPADPIVEHLTLEAAVEQMPFTVLVPARLPDSEHSQVEVTYHPPRLRSRGAFLNLGYHGSEVYKRLSIYESAVADPETDRFEWERVEHAGKQLLISDPGTEGDRIVAFEQQGTHVTIWSDLEREPLFDLAVSLVPPASTPGHSARGCGLAG